MLPVLVTGSLGQTNTASKNNPYSPSPTAEVRSDPKTQAQPMQIAFAMTPSQKYDGDQDAVINDRRPESRRRALDPTSVYLIGIGDVLFITLKNVPGGSGYFTVRADGSIDYPLAGDDVIVAGEMPAKVIKHLESRITLFPNPRVELNVSHYASHEVIVTGNVESPGIKILRREAVPLFVIKAEAGVGSKTTTVKITRAQTSSFEIFALSDPSSDDVLIFPGDEVSFSSDLKK